METWKKPSRWPPRSILMAFKKLSLLIISLFLVTGCATKKAVVKETPVDIYADAQGYAKDWTLVEEKKLREKEKYNELEKYKEERVWLDEEEAFASGYRKGAQESIKTFVREFIGNPFPYYYWQAPLVQQVYIPARVVGGSFQPGHWEYVIIMPGNWEERFSYPIGNEKEKKTE